MTATIISNTPPYQWGMETNRTIGRLLNINQQLARLQEAVATASAGWTGVDGAQFEIGNTTNGNSNQNLFGVVADPETPGAKGKDYSYAIGQLQTAWATFWTAALPYIEQLDNGVVTM
jgi:hypothetical protein